MTRNLLVVTSCRPTFRSLYLDTQKIQWRTADTRRPSLAAVEAVPGRGDTGLLATGHRWLEMGSAGHVGDLVSHDFLFLSTCSVLLQTLEPCSYSQCVKLLIKWPIFAPVTVCSNPQQASVRWSTLHGSSLPLPDPSRGCGGVSQHIQTSSTHPMASRLIVHLLTLNLQLSDAQTFKSWRESKDNKDGRCR